MKCVSRAPIAPNISTRISLTFLLCGEDVEGLERESRPQATAWFAPLPPGLVVKEVAVRVSPGEGKRGVMVTRSALREPMMRIVEGISVLFLCL